MGEISDILEVPFPLCCAACGQVLETASCFCGDCGVQVERTNMTDSCPLCAEPQTRGDLCGRCLNDPPAFRSMYAPFVHEGAVAKAIHQLKYEDAPQLALPLAKLLAQEAAAFLNKTQGALCPIPVHERRFHERKFDQAALLAKALSEQVERPMLPNLLKRLKHTQRQVGLSETEREDNLKDAFSASSLVKGNHIILIDDVFTTGSTAKAAAKALIEAGARTVHVLTLTRANLTTG